MKREEIKVRNAQIIEMYEAGMSSSAIGKVVNLGVAQVCKILKDNNVKITYNYSSKKFTDKMLIDAIAEGVTMTKFAERYSVSIGAVWNRAKRLNLQFENVVSKNDRNEMHRLRELGYSNAEIAERVAHCGGTVRRVLGKQPKAMTNANILYGVEKRKMNARRRTQLSAIMINVRAAEAEQKRIEAEQKATAEKLRMILACAGFDDGKIVDFEKAKAFVEMMDKVV